MRDILFRGKRTDTGQWVFGQYFARDDYTVILTKKGAVYKGRNQFYHGISLTAFDVDPDTVGQYTGLTDKNGKRIFEGDIVYYSCSDISAIVKQGQYTDLDLPNKSAVGYYVEYLEDGKTVQESMDSRESDEEFGCEVIGNATDNPELMEVGE